jgi:thiamine biosynthesis lipoprotein
MARARPATPRIGAPRLERADGCFVGRFTAMASPCEVLIDTDDRAAARELVAVAEREALRVEAKFSRYRADNIVHRINHSDGRPVELDEETALLIDYAATCHAASDGRFDITSGVLRRVWTFDGGSRVPTSEAIAEALSLVGWHRVTREGSSISLPAGMEIDLGGIGKEYAVDRAAALVGARTGAAFLVNFGGDLWASGPRRNARDWGVGVDDPERTGAAVLYRVDLTRGGLATSGDARRFVMWQGRRLGHILDPRTGWPVEGAPRAVTVLGRNCLEAGTLSTLAYLQGPGARAFPEQQGVQFWLL